MIWLVVATVAVFGALLLDHFGFAGRNPRLITPGRIIGAMLILAGVALFVGLR